MNENKKNKLQMTIQTRDELLDFIQTNFEKLSNEKYIELLKLTLQVYVFGKPKLKKKLLKKYSTIISL